MYCKVVWPDVDQKCDALKVDMSIHSVWNHSEDAQNLLKSDLSIGYEVLMIAGVDCDDIHRLNETTEVETRKEAVVFLPSLRDKGLSNYAKYVQNYQKKEKQEKEEKNKEKQKKEEQNKEEQKKEEHQTEFIKTDKTDCINAKKRNCEIATVNLSTDIDVSNENDEKSTGKTCSDSNILKTRKSMTIAQKLNRSTQNVRKRNK